MWILYNLWGYFAIFHNLAAKYVYSGMFHISS